MSERKRDREELGAEVVEAAELLDAAASREEEDLAEAAALSDAPGLDRVDAILDRAWEERDRADAVRESGPGRWRRPSTGLALLAAAAVVAVVVVVSREPAEDPRGPGPSGVVLGGEELAITSPTPGDEDWTRVTWSGPAGERFRVEIVDPATGRVLAGPHTTGDTSWRPEWPGDLATWPDRVLVRVEIHVPGEPHPESVEALVEAPR